MGDILFSIVILPCFFIVFILSGILVKYVPVASQGRYSGIDGLRGYLALMVAVHHFYIFYQWRIGGEWKEPSLVFFNNLGVFAVAVFFMITGFLFIGKIDKASFFNNFDFVGLIKSRLYRILPLYFFAASITIFISLYITGFTLKVDSGLFIKQVLRWFLFVGDSINGYSEAKRITAGVTWTLRYEWFFYLSLFFVYFISKNRYALVICGFLVALLAMWDRDFLIFNSLYFIFFVTGGVAYFLSKSKRLSEVLDEKLIKSNKSSFAMCGLILFALTINEKEHLLLFSSISLLFFMFVVLGGDLFGLLSMTTSKFLGEISYSIYLMHGVVLFIIFNLLFNGVFPLSFFEYCMLLPVFLFLVVVVSCVTYLKIEHPFILFGKRKNINESSAKV